MKVSSAAFVGFQLIDLLDQNVGQDISITEIQDQIEQGSLLEFLEDRLGDELDLSLFEGETRQELMALFQFMDTSRPHKYAQHKGLCFLLGLILEALQHPKAFGLTPSASEAAR